MTFSVLNSAGRLYALFSSLLMCIRHIIFKGVEEICYPQRINFSLDKSFCPRMLVKTSSVLVCPGAEKAGVEVPVPNRSTGCTSTLTLINGKQPYIARFEEAVGCKMTMHSSNPRSSAGSPTQNGSRVTFQISQRRGLQEFNIETK